jgi:hypothetical protein
VGINTEDPQGMLHVDAKGDTNAGGIEDDVVVTSQGRIGVGTLDPQARLDVRGSIRIADGTQGGGRILTSDTQGVAKWANVVGSWYAALRGGSSLGANSGLATDVWPPFVFNASELSPPGRGSVDLATGTIKVPYTGMYKIMVNGIAYTNFQPQVFLAYPCVMVNNVRLDIKGDFTLHMPRSLGAADFGCMTFLPLNEGDEVMLAPVAGNVNASTYHANQYTNTMLHIEFVK